MRDIYNIYLFIIYVYIYLFIYPYIIFLSENCVMHVYLH